jgi:hypothetical protein
MPSQAMQDAIDALRARRKAEAAEATEQIGTFLRAQVH